MKKTALSIVAAIIVILAILLLNTLCAGCVYAQQVAAFLNNSPHGVRMAGTTPLTQTSFTAALSGSNTHQLFLHPVHFKIIELSA